jgi:hypothetical protein
VTKVGDIGVPYRARVDERHFINLPGFHGGAYIVAYVEDTSARDPGPLYYCRPNCSSCPHNFEPRLILEIADCADRINLEFELHSNLHRTNSLHKLDTLITALTNFRAGLIAECEEYDRRERDLAVSRDA